MGGGQAAGTAAALSIEGDCGARAVAVTALQEILRRTGAVLETPREIALTGAEDWKANRENAR